jgi:altronate hydrolase
MPDIIDFDTGPIITGAKTVEQMGEDRLELVITTASGNYTPKAIALVQDDFLPWKRGVSHEDIFSATFTTTARALG